jgi:hypothetical protein
MKEIEMATTATSTPEQRESREQDKAGKSQIVVVDLDEPQSPVAVKRLRKGKGQAVHITSNGSSKTSLTTAPVQGPVHKPVVDLVRELPKRRLGPCSATTTTIETEFMYPAPATWRSDQGRTALRRLAQRTSRGG